jgi:hypothetical protein
MVSPSGRPTVIDEWGHPRSSLPTDRWLRTQNVTDTVRTLVWRRIDEPGMEIAHVESLAQASGTQIGGAYELRWRLDGSRLELEVVGERRATVELGDADFFDVFASPFFNSLPVARDRLLDGGPARDYVMRFVRVPDLVVVRSEQRYEPKAGRVIRYSSGSFSADIAFDADGFVTRYEGFLERISRPTGRQRVGPSDRSVHGSDR